MNGNSNSKHGMSNKQYGYKSSTNRTLGSGYSQNCSAVATLFAIAMSRRSLYGMLLTRCLLNVVVGSSEGVYKAGSNIAPRI